MTSDVALQNTIDGLEALVVIAAGMSCAAIIFASTAAIIYVAAKLIFKHFPLDPDYD